MAIYRRDMVLLMEGTRLFDGSRVCFLLRMASTPWIVLPRHETFAENNRVRGSRMYWLPIRRVELPIVCILMQLWRSSLHPGPAYTRALAHNAAAWQII